MRAFFPMLVPLLFSAVTLSCTSDPATDVTVPVPVASLSVEPTNVVIQVGTSTQFSAIARDSSGGTLSGRITAWTSTDNRVARVGAAGVVNGVAPGSVEIIATAEGKSARAGITVSSAPLVVDAGADQIISLGARAAFNATVTSTGPGPVRMFWSKISGPGKVSIATEMFNSSFDDPTMTDWIGTGQSPTGLGIIGSQGNWYATSGAVATSQDRAHSGVSSWKARTPTDWQHSAKLLRWAFDKTEAYYSGWFWWPSNEIVNGHGIGPFFNYLNLFQFKERSSPYNPTWIVGVMGKTGSSTLDQFIIHDWYNRQPIVKTEVEVPKDQWANVTIYMKEGSVTASDGAIAVFLTQSPDAGVTWTTSLLYYKTGIITLGGATNTSPPHLMWGISNYSDALVGQGAESIYWDDAVVNPVDAGSILTTTATFSATGSYVLRLTAFDGTRTISDDVTITVQ